MYDENMLIDLGGENYGEQIIRTVSEPDFYFSDSEINEEVTGIYRYDEECNLIPFSFDPVKAEKLEREYNEQKDKENEQTDGIEIEDLFSINGMDEDEWDVEI